VLRGGQNRRGNQAIVDAHFKDALTNAPGVPRISLFHAANAADDSRDRIGIFETVQPGGKFPCLTHLDHDCRKCIL